MAAAHQSADKIGPLLKRLRKEPWLLASGFYGWLNGWRYRIQFAIQFKRFRAGRWLRVYGPLAVSGPGKVTLGDNCLIISNAIKPVCIRTLSREASVTLDDGAGLNGTSIQCVNSVSIGRLANIADAYITDTTAHSLHKNRRQESVTDVASDPVVIEGNVWVSVQVVILHGVTIGRNSVIGACSLVRRDVPADVFAAGNPLRVIKPIR